MLNLEAYKYMKFSLSRRVRSGIGAVTNTLRHIERINTSGIQSNIRVQTRSGLRKIDLHVIEKELNTNVQGTIQIGNWLRTSSSFKPCFSNRAYSTPLHARDVLKWVTAVDSFNQSEVELFESSLTKRDEIPADFAIEFDAQTGEGNMDWVNNVAYVTHRVENLSSIQHPGKDSRGWMNISRWTQPLITSFQSELMDSGIARTKLKVRIEHHSDAKAESDETVTCESSWVIDDNRETLIKYVESIPGVISSR